MVDAGLLVTIDSDDPPMFGTDAVNDFRALARALGYGREQFENFTRNALEAAWLNPSDRANLARTVEERLVALLVCKVPPSGSLRLGNEQPELAQIRENDVAIVGCDVKPVVAIEAGVGDRVGLQLQAFGKGLVALRVERCPGEPSLEPWNCQSFGSRGTRPMALRMV